MKKKIKLEKYAKVSGNQLKKWAEWLKENGSGCCSSLLLTDDNDNDWYILMGWSGGFDESDNSKWQSGTWKICTEIGYQPSNCIMQCDLDVDFLMPYNEETGEVDDTNTALADEPDWVKLADELNKEAERVVSKWAYFEPEEKEEVA